MKDKSAEGLNAQVGYMSDTNVFEESETTKQSPQKQSRQVIEYPKGSGKKYTVDENGDMTPI